MMEGQQVYNTKLKDERFSVECVAFLEGVRVIQYVVDTGTMLTYCNYKVIIELGKQKKIKYEVVNAMDTLHLFYVIKQRIKNNQQMRRMK